MSTFRNVHDYQFTLERETTWGTAVDSAPIGLATENLEIGISPDEHNIMRARGNRGISEADMWLDTNRMIPTAKFGCVATPTNLQTLVPGILQKATDWAAAANLWTYYTANYADLPTPKASNSGYFYTLTKRSPDSSNSEKVTSAVMRSMKFSVHPTDNQSSLYLETEWFGKAFSRGNNPSGTVTQESLASVPYLWSNLVTASYGATNILAELRSAEINVTAGAKFAFDNPAGAVIFPMWEVGGQFTIAGGSDAETLKALCLSSAVSTADTLTLGWNTGGGAPNADDEITLASFCYLTNYKTDDSDLELVTFDFKGVFGTIASSEYPFVFKNYQA